MRLAIAFGAGFATAAAVAGAGWFLLAHGEARSPASEAAATAAEPPGFWIIRAEPDEASFLDAARVVGSGPERTAWVYRLWRHPQSWKGKSYVAIKLFYRWDCAGRRSRLETGGTFDRDLSLIDRAELRQAEWEGVFPDSGQEGALDIVCTGKSPAGAPRITTASFREVARAFWADPKRYAYAP